jgi:mRNA interferase YafQ
VKYDIVPTKRYIKDVKRLAESGFDISLLDEVIDKLASGDTLDAKYRDHQLKGALKGFRDCHIRDDWVLVYKREKATLVLLLSRTGPHSSLGF